MEHIFDHKSDDYVTACGYSEEEFRKILSLINKEERISENIERISKIVTDPVDLLVIGMWMGFLDNERIIKQD